MKMSDVFDLQLMHDSDLEYISNLSGDNLAAFNTLEQDRAAVHAINNHDKLVELNKELVEALELCCGVIDAYGISELGIDLINSPSNGRKKVQGVLDKAKELNQ